MSFSDTDGAPSASVLVQLLDAALSRPVKSWRFQNCQLISIGRLPNCDVEINDPYVSRLHAELRFEAGEWSLIARGQNGVVVDHQQVQCFSIDSQVTFQLGAAGPLLRFQCEAEEAECGRTLCFDHLDFPEFALDESKLREEVGEIAEDDYFLKLQSQAKSLRARRR